MRSWWIKAVVMCALLAGGCGGSVLPQIQSETERLAVARRMMSERHYLQAAELLKSFVANNPGSADVDEALYMLGEAHLLARDWPSAELEFERMLRDYPESDSSAAASFRLGEALFGQARGPDFDQEYTMKALAQWESYQRSYPGHWLQGEVTRRLGETRQRIATKLLKTGNLYLKLRLTEPARTYFHRVIDEFAETPQAAEASLGLALADALSGMKPEAIQQLKQIEAAFPGQLLAARAARERARLER